MFSVQIGRGSTWLGAMMGFISWELVELLLPAGAQWGDASMGRRGLTGLILIEAQHLSVPPNS